MFNERDRKCAAVQLMSLRSKLWQQDHCQHPQNANLGGSTLEGAAQSIGRPFGGGGAEVSSEDHIMPPHIFEVGLKVNTKVYLDVLKSMVIPWWNQVVGGRPWVWQQDSALAHKSKETQAWLQKECYDFALFSHCLSPPPTWTRRTTSFGHTSRTTPKPAWSPISTEYLSSSRRRLWKRHAPSSGSIWRRWLRLKAASLKRCQLYHIIKLPELIYSIKV